MRKVKSTRHSTPAIRPKGLFSITFNRSFLQGVRTAKWQRTALVAGKIPPNNLSLSAAILIDKADKLDARHVAGAGPSPFSRQAGSGRRTPFSSRSVCQFAPAKWLPDMDSNHD